jgi:hypothetical protein
MAADCAQHELSQIVADSGALMEFLCEPASIQADQVQQVIDQSGHALAPLPDGHQGVA